MFVNIIFTISTFIKLYCLIYRTVFHHICSFYHIWTSKWRLFTTYQSHRFTSFVLLGTCIARALSLPCLVCTTLRRRFGWTSRQSSGVAEPTYYWRQLGPRSVDVQSSNRVSRYSGQPRDPKKPFGRRVHLRQRCYHCNSLTRVQWRFRLRDQSP